MTSPFYGLYWCSSRPLASVNASLGDAAQRQMHGFEVRLTSDFATLSVDNPKHLAPASFVCLWWYVAQSASFVVRYKQVGYCRVAINAVYILAQSLTVLQYCVETSSIGSLRYIEWWECLANIIARISH